MARLFSPEELFNCLPNSAAPAWTDYTALELAACKDHDGETEAGVAFDDAHFFAVYGRTLDGLAEAITDIFVDADALPIAGHLARLSGLPLTLYRS